MVMPNIGKVLRSSPREPPAPLRPALLACQAQHQCDQHHHGHQHRGDRGGDSSHGGGAKHTERYRGIWWIASTVRSIRTSPSPPLRARPSARMPWTWSASSACPTVTQASWVIEENVLLRSGDQQTVATLKGVEPQYLVMSRMDQYMFSGEPTFEGLAGPAAILGHRLEDRAGRSLGRRGLPAVGDQCADPWAQTEQISSNGRSRPSPSPCVGRTP